MNRLSVLVSLLILSSLLQAIPSAIAAPNLISQSPESAARKVDFGKHFRELGVEGSILIYDANNNQTFQHNPQRNGTAFLPVSTFKILNSLISLETGVIPDEVAVLTWDGIPRDFPEWNHDLNMREAFKRSAVWFYQVLARKVGHERMQKFVTEAGYGNQKIGGKEDIDKFWLQGALRITPQQQIQFLNRLYKDNLPFSKRSLSVVKDIMVVEQTPDYTIRSKTGLSMLGITPEIGWYVGYLEKGRNVYFFAVNMDIRSKKDVPIRKELMRLCFKDLGLL
jgi:beta-lactamase class D